MLMNDRLTEQDVAISGYALDAAKQLFPPLANRAPIVETAKVIQSAIDQATSTLTQKLAEVEKLKDYLIKDSCDDDTRIRDLCRPFIDVEGDSHSVPGIVELVERLTEKLRLVLALPGQLLDVHAICVQRDKAVQRADELAAKLAELERENSIRSRQQAYGPHRPTVPQLIAALQMIPAHVEVQSVSINGQTGTMVIEARHDEGDQVYAFQEEHKGDSEYRWEPTTEERPSTPTERPENNTCPRCGVTNFIPKSSTALCPNCERTYYAEQ